MPLKSGTGQLVTDEDTLLLLMVLATFCAAGISNCNTALPTVLGGKTASGWVEYSSFSLLPPCRILLVKYILLLCMCGIVFLHFGGNVYVRNCHTGVLCDSYKCSRDFWHTC